MDITITLPDHTTEKDLLAAAGAIIQASTVFVDWERLHTTWYPEPDAISAPGLMLLSLARQLTSARDA